VAILTAAPSDGRQAQAQMREARRVATDPAPTSPC
jgi:hypothetical protein